MSIRGDLRYRIGGIPSLSGDPPSAIPWQASKRARARCLALAARLALERPIPKPLQVFLHAATAAKAEQRWVAGSESRAKPEPRTLLIKCLCK